MSLLHWLGPTHSHVGNTYLQSKRWTSSWPSTSLSNKSIESLTAAMKAVASLHCQLAYIVWIKWIGLHENFTIIAFVGTLILSRTLNFNIPSIQWCTSWSMEKGNYHVRVYIPLIHPTWKPWNSMQPKDYFSSRFDAKISFKDLESV